MSRILIVGAGVVGKATGTGLIEHGHKVTFVDVNPATLRDLETDGYDAITPSEIFLDGVDAVFVSVTALTSEQDGIDLSHLLDATRNLGEKLSDTSSSPVIVYRCTLPPGTVRNTLTPLLEQTSRKRAGVGFGVVYNPEFLRAHRALEDFRAPRAVVLASHIKESWAHQIIQGILRDFGAPMHWLELEQAELLKYANNVYNAYKITFFNFMRLFAGMEGVDPEPVFALSALTAEGLYNPLYGTRDLGPYDGVCLPKDTEALRYLVAQTGEDPALLESIQNINRRFGGTR